MVIFCFFFFGELPQIRTKYLCRTRNAHREQKGRHQVNFPREINHNLSFSNFSKTEAINLK